METVAMETVAMETDLVCISVYKHYYVYGVLKGLYDYKHICIVLSVCCHL